MERYFILSLNRAVGRKAGIKKKRTGKSVGPDDIQLKFESIWRKGNSMAK